MAFDEELGSDEFVLFGTTLTAYFSVYRVDF
jgi:hypothetical protein